MNIFKTLWSFGLLIRTQLNIKFLMVLSYSQIMRVLQRFWDRAYVVQNMNNTVIKQKTLDLTDLPDKASIYLVGDIHGRMDMLKLLLHDSGYDSSIDYLFATGDLIDRGNKNVEVLNFFSNHPRRHTVIGNHEDMATDPAMRNIWINNGGDTTWLELEESFHDKDWMRNVVEPMPHLIEVILKNDRFRIVHAEIPINLTEDKFQELLARNDKYLKECLIWSRKSTAPFSDISVIENIHTNRWIINKINSQIEKITNALTNNHSVLCFCGHTPLPDPLVLPNRITLDLGMDDMALYNFKRKEYTKYSDISDNY